MPPLNRLPSVGLKRIIRAGGVLTESKLPKTPCELRMIAFWISLHLAQASIRVSTTKRAYDLLAHSIL